MLFPEQVIPFLQHDDPIVRDHVLDYFRDSYAFGPLTADHYWAVIDRLGENDSTLGFAANLMDVPQTDSSLHRLLRALAGKPLEIFEFHYQHAAGAMDLGVLTRHRDELLSCPQLLPHVRERLELRLNLLEQGPAAAWDRLMQHGRELGHAYAFSFNPNLSDALIEAAARGGPSICEKALAALADPSTANHWGETFAVRVLGVARYEPAVDALVEMLAIDADLLLDEVNRALARIGTPQVIERLVAFYPGKPWDVRLFTHAPLAKIKRPQSVAALMEFVGMELALEGQDLRAEEPLTDSLLIDLTELGSLAGLEESRRLIAAFPDDPEILELCERLLATAVMTGVTLPEEVAWRSRIKARNAVHSRKLDIYTDFDGVRENWRKTGVPYLPDAKAQPSQAAASIQHSSVPLVEPRSVPVATIRNTAPKIGRNDPCPCGSQKKYKKCCGK